VPTHYNQYDQFITEIDQVSFIALSLSYAVLIRMHTIEYLMFNTIMTFASILPIGLIYVMDIYLPDRKIKTDGYLAFSVSKVFQSFILLVSVYHIRRATFKTKVLLLENLKNN
jgi:hypothetical protein